VREATIFGEAVHALVEVTFATLELERRGTRFRVAEARLEDVFVCLSRALAAGV
jgi:hypothetical protein